MGRKVRRVPMDFDWPLHKPWRGFINPHWKECPVCKGSGSTVAATRLSDLVRLLLLSGSDAARKRCHPYFNDMPLHESVGKVCGREMLELTTGLAGRAPSPCLGHDAIDSWSAEKKIIQAAGLPEDWGTCPACRGAGIPAENKPAYDAWQQEDPPSGEGWQIWETVSEGSPISPVFATPEELARYSVGTRWGADNGTSYETWLAFITGPGHAPSMVGDEHGLRDGVQAIVDMCSQ